jgi:hypothetical protein
VGLLAGGRAGAGDAAASRGGEGDGSPGATQSRGSHGGPRRRRRSEPENLGLGVGGVDAGEKKLPWGGGVRGKVGAAEDRRWWPELPSYGADMERGGRGHPHLIFSPLSDDGVARRQGAPPYTLPSPLRRVWWPSRISFASPSRYEKAPRGLSETGAGAGF